ncbi:phage minor capsid protein [Jonquetella anthropi]|uniref:phage minor capsid protein n=1 Tax=Jonquetella anthropi TaxID=428712 RepID=UPI0005875EC9|nr:phage minor capsid protein [Jonquetella anthropi]
MIFPSRGLVAPYTGARIETDSAGLSWNMGSYAEMLSRTTLMQVHNAATWNEFAEHGEDLIQISYHTPTCEMCAPWNGKVLSLTGKTPGYPTLTEAEDAGLFHPNCRHASSLFLEGIDSKEQALPEWMRGGAADNVRGHLEPGELTADVIKADFKRAGRVISDAEAKQIRQDMYDYTTEGGGYGKIRAAQKLGDTKSLYYQKGERIEEWLHVAPVYPPHKDLYRGISGDAVYKTLDKYQPSDKYQERALASASSKLRVASEFSKQKAGEHSVMIVIQGGLPYGASIRGCSENIDEYEVLVNKNAVFEIVRKEERRIFKGDKEKSLVFVVRYKQERE